MIVDFPGRPVLALCAFSAGQGGLGRWALVPFLVGELRSHSRGQKILKQSQVGGPGRKVAENVDAPINGFELPSGVIEMKLERGGQPTPLCGISHRFRA